MVIYLDVVMGMNFLVDFLLLVSADRLAGCRTSWGRLFTGAGIGAIYAGACLLPGFLFLSNSLWRLVSLIAMGCCAFGWDLSGGQRCAVFTLLSLALAGAAAAIRVNHYISLLGCAGLIWLLCRFSFFIPPGRQYMEIELDYHGRHVSALALVDTGNLLRDPITGENVMVADCRIGAELLNISEEMFKDPAKLLISGQVPGLRLIPYHSVGVAGGVMPMIRIRDAKIGNRKTDMLVAFAPEKIGDGGMYQMLVGGAI